MEMQVIKNKSTLELQKHEETLRAQLFALRIQSSLGKLETPHMINNLRKDIARIKTELNIRIKNGEPIKPLHINKMVLPEEKKESNKIKKNTKVEKKDIKVKTTTKSEVVKETDKDDNQVIFAKTMKAKSPKKKLKTVTTTKVKSPSKKSTVKTTTVLPKEDKG